MAVAVQQLFWHKSTCVLFSALTLSDAYWVWWWGSSRRTTPLTKRGNLWLHSMATQWSATTMPSQGNHQTSPGKSLASTMQHSDQTNWIPQPGHEGRCRAKGDKVACRLIIITSRRSLPRHLVFTYFLASFGIEQGQKGLLLRHLWQVKRFLLLVWKMCFAHAVYSCFRCV